MRLHDLRHSYASILLASGVNLKTVSSVLGHSKVGVTGDTYAHVTPAMAHSAAARLDRMIGSNATDGKLESNVFELRDQFVTSKRVLRDDLRTG